VGSNFDADCSNKCAYKDRSDSYQRHGAKSPSRTLQVIQMILILGSYDKRPLRKNIDSFVICFGGFCIPFAGVGVA
jgi:hypothetical protein